MDLAIDTIEPTTFAAGETVQWRCGAGAYLAADGWGLKYYFAGAVAFAVAATVDGAAFLVTLTAASTAAHPAGLYRWAAYAERGAGAEIERIPIARGRVTITANVTTALAGALQSHAERMLAAIRAVLEGRTTADVEQFTIAGKAVTQIPFAELQKAERRYARRVKLDRNGGQLPPVEVTFGRA